MIASALGLLAAALVLSLVQGAGRLLLLSPAVYPVLFGALHWAVLPTVLFFVWALLKSSTLAPFRAVPLVGAAGAAAMIGAPWGGMVAACLGLWTAVTRAHGRLLDGAGLLLAILFPMAATLAAFGYWRGVYGASAAPMPAGIFFHGLTNAIDPARVIGWGSGEFNGEQRAGLAALIVGLGLGAGIGTIGEERRMLMVLTALFALGGVMGAAPMVAFMAAALMLPARMGWAGAGPARLALNALLQLLGLGLMGGAILP